MNALLTDLYELTMAAGYFQTGIFRDSGSFELSIRRLPAQRGFLVVCGIAQAAEYLLGLRFTTGEIDYLRTLPQFSRAPKEFFAHLLDLRFTGDLYAVPEGTPMFGGEPLLRVRAPMIEAQLAETYLLAMIAFQTLIATKAARIVQVAGGRSIIEFGTRRAHSPEAGTLAGRAAYVGGCTGTSNVLSGFRYGIPVFGTAAHSWVQAFEDEFEAQRQLQELLGEGTIYLVDTYDTIEGTRKVARLGRPIWGVRIDSGDRAVLSRAVRKILDRAGLQEARIMATGDLDEYKIRELLASGAPIDAFGVGTELATSADAPALAAVYKLVEMESGGNTRYTAKFSEDKIMMPAAKQVWRYRAHSGEDARDYITRYDEPAPGPDARPLLEPVIRNGKLVKPLADAHQARAHAAEAIRTVPEACLRLKDPGPYLIQHSDELLRLLEIARKQFRGEQE
ncbi:MAG TPA: nicotinate phosphoribosyltransferase [Bryobacteraceae bacterium]|nr:nicotinate phosphoribosyltransferase [Bryobacteraceae bacterium]